MSGKVAVVVVVGISVAVCRCPAVGAKEMVPKTKTETERVKCVASTRSTKGITWMSLRVEVDVAVAVKC